ncbi:hypothetical protein BJ165DRAFT_1446755 [Panaeolus papilionaceus]|nr:hypothetical protein BJ165DRAFT_1446755 [Panaeolus papilionaceus]
MEEEIAFSTMPFKALDIMIFITTALKSPRNPIHCSGSVTIALAALKACPDYESISYGGDATREEKRWKMKMHKTLYRFVVSRRPLPQVKPWMKQFSTCPDCKPYSRRSSMSALFHVKWEHHRGRITGDHAWFSSQIAGHRTKDILPADPCCFMIRAISFLCETLQTDRAGFKAKSQSRTNDWPADISHLMPFNPDQVVGSIIQWHHIYPKPIVFHFLSLIACLVRFPVYPTLNRYRFAAIVMDSTKNVIDSVISMFDTPKDERSTSEFNSLCDTFVDKTRTFFDCVRTMTALYLPGETKTFLVDGCAVKAIQLCTLIHCLIPNVKASLNGQSSKRMKEADYDTLMNDSRDLGCRVYRMFKIQQTTGPSQPDILHAAEVAERDHQGFFGSYDGFEGEIGLSYIWGNGLEYGCFAKRCSIRQWLEGDTLKLKICSGCTGAYYCGTSCETKDWNDDETPHKMICPILARVISGQVPEMFQSISKDTSRFSTMVLKIKARGKTDLETIKTIREMIQKANLNDNEERILKDWGRSAYHVFEVTWGPGFDDYTSTLAHLADPTGVFGASPGRHNNSFHKFN